MEAEHDRSAWKAIYLKKTVILAIAAIGLTACTPSQRQADLQAQQKSRAEDFRYALDAFAKDGSRNRIYIESASQEARQIATRYIQDMGGIATEGRDADFLLHIESETYPECRSETEHLLGSSTFRTSGTGVNFIYVAGILIKNSGPGNSPTIVFAGDASDCGRFSQRNRLEGYVAAQALANFSAPVCNPQNQSLRPYYFRCAVSSPSAGEGQINYSTVVSQSKVPMLLSGATQANRLNRVRIAAPQHLLVPSARYISEVGGIPVISGDSEFVLKIETTRTSRCENKQSPVGVFASLLTSTGSILATAGIDICTSLYRNQGEREILSQIFTSRQFND